jgi:hypothetical protein
MLKRGQNRKKLDEFINLIEEGLNKEVKQHLLKNRCLYKAYHDKVSMVIHFTFHTFHYGGSNIRR